MCKDAQLEKEEEIKKMTQCSRSDDPPLSGEDSENSLHNLCKKVRNMISQFFNRALPIQNLSCIGLALTLSKYCC